MFYRLHLYFTLIDILQHSCIVDAYDKQTLRNTPCGWVHCTLPHCANHYAIIATVIISVILSVIIIDIDNIFSLLSGYYCCCCNVVVFFFFFFFSSSSALVVAFPTFSLRLSFGKRQRQRNAACTHFSGCLSNSKHTQWDTHRHNNTPTQIRGVCYLGLPLSYYLLILCYQRQRRDGKALLKPNKKKKSKKLKMKKKCIACVYVCISVMPRQSERANWKEDADDPRNFRVATPSPPLRLLSRASLHLADTSAHSLTIRAAAGSGATARGGGTAIVALLSVYFAVCRARFMRKIDAHVLPVAPQRGEGEEGERGRGGLGNTLLWWWCQRQWLCLAGHRDRYYLQWALKIKQSIIKNKIEKNSKTASQKQNTDGLANTL